MNAGELVLRIACGPEGVGRVDCLSTRPLVAHALLSGRDPAQVPELVGRLFAVCGQAQSTAARTACEAALGVDGNGAARERDALLAAELVHEHLWHFLIDLPRSSGAQALAQAMATARNAGGVEAYSQVAEAHVFGRGLAAWRAIASLEALASWAADTSTPVARLLASHLEEGPALGASDVALLDENDPVALRTGLFAPLESRPGYAQLPHWSDGGPRETGALARQFQQPLVALAREAWGHGIATRLLARLAELAAMLEELARGAPARRHGAVAGPTGVGYAWAHTARGLLAHRVEVVRGRIHEYDIVAPTEWNFHPCGPFARGARRIAERDPAVVARRARALAASLDPCVAWRVETVHA